MTTVGYVGGIDYNRYQQYQTQGMQTNPYYNMDAGYSQSDAYVSSSGETCTDGKDDGKIGFFGAIGNAIKGVGKAIGNGIKGMFTGKDGKFSLGKTLLSIGTAALCIAVPAVGVAACVVGGAMGAVQVGKGVYKAATAETDAEAKQAWQDIGGGTFTVAASVVGAKAGVKAVKATSSAGGAKGVSALSQLDDAATMGQKAAALGKDMVSSTKNQVGSIKNAATPYAQAAKIKYAEAKAAKIQKNSGALTQNELHAVNNAKYQRMFASDDTLAALDKMDDLTGIANKYYGKARTKVSNVKHNAQSYAEAAKIKYAEAKAARIKNPGALTPDELHTINNAKYQKMFASDDALAALDKMDDIAGTANKYYGKAKTTASDAIKHPIQTGKNAWNAGKNAWNTAKGKVTEGNAQKLWSGIQDAYNKNIKGQTLSQLGNKLTGTAKNIWSDLSTGKYSYPEVVSKYGYENVAQVIQYMGGTVFSSELI